MRKKTFEKLGKDLLGYSDRQIVSEVLDMLSKRQLKRLIKNLKIKWN